MVKGLVIDVIVVITGSGVFTTSVLFKATAVVVVEKVVSFIGLMLLVVDISDIVVLLELRLRTTVGEVDATVLIVGLLTVVVMVVDVIVDVMIAVIDVVLIEGVIVVDVIVDVVDVIVGFEDSLVLVVFIEFVIVDKVVVGIGVVLVNVKSKLQSALSCSRFRLISTHADDRLFSLLYTASLIMLLSKYVTKMSLLICLSNNDLKLPFESALVY